MSISKLSFVYFIMFLLADTIDFRIIPKVFFIVSEAPCTEGNGCRFVRFCLQKKWLSAGVSLLWDRVLIVNKSL